MDRRRFIAGSVVATAAAVSGTRPASASHAIPPLPARPETTSLFRVVRARHDRIYRFPPARTALLVVDMQKDFFVLDGGRYDPALAPIVPRVHKLVEFARTIGCRVIHTREGYAPNLSDLNPYRKSLGFVGKKTSLGRFLVRGEPGHDFIDELRPQPNEVIIDKPGFNAFFKSSLGEELRRASISHLILCGVTTQCCVHATLKAAVDQGYWCLTVANCCAAYDVRIHKATLDIISSDGHLFGCVASLANVRTSKEVMLRH